MKILRLIASVDPEGGGPIEGALIMAGERTKAGDLTEFVTLDSPESSLVRNFPYPVHGTGPSLSPAHFARAVASLAPRFDVAVIHGLWNNASIGGLSALASAGLPWVIYTHGMLDPYFRQAKPIKHWVKQVYWTLWQGRALSEAHAVLFTCEEERRLARNAFWGHQHYNGRVVAYAAAEMQSGVSEDRTAFSAQVPRLGGRDYLLYLSRIHPKKGCDHLIEAFAAVANLDPGLDLVIAGPDKTGWRPKLEALAARLGVAERIHWAGMVKGAAKKAAFLHARAFVLPSHQENFGIVVAEALSAGTPVLISDKVNIWREIQACGAGFVAPDTLAGTTQLLRDFLCLHAGQVSALRAAARPCYDAHFSVPAAAADLNAVLSEAAQSRSLS